MITTGRRRHHDGPPTARMSGTRAVASRCPGCGCMHRTSAPLTLIHTRARWSLRRGCCETRMPTSCSIVNESHHSTPLPRPLQLRPRSVNRPGADADCPRQTHPHPDVAGRGSPTARPRPRPQRRGLARNRHSESPMGCDLTPRRDHRCGAPPPPARAGGAPHHHFPPPAPQPHARAAPRGGSPPVRCPTVPGTTARMLAAVAASAPGPGGAAPRRGRPRQPLRKAQRDLCQTGGTSD